MVTQTTLIIIGIGIALSTLILGLIFAYYRAGSRKKAGIQYYNQGITKAKRGDCAGAIEAFTQALRVNSNLVEAYIKRGIARAKLGQQQEAIEDFTHVIIINPTDANVYMNRGNIRADINDMQGAIEDYRKAAKLFFEKKDQANYRQALSAFKQLQRRQKHPTKESSSSQADEEVFNQGLYNVKIGNYKGAIEDFNQVLQLAPQSDKAYYNRGMARFKLSDNEGAKADFTQALKINSRYAEAYLSRGSVHRKLGSYQPAIQDFTQALELKPNDAHAYYNRAITYSELGEKRRSLDDKRKALEDYQKAANLFFEQGDMVNYNRAMKNLPAIEAGDIDSQPTQNNSSLPSSTTCSSNADRENQRSLPSLKLERKLINLLNGNRSAAERLIEQTRYKNPGKSENWYWEKVIYDLERDRRQ
ncbi:tetratricopeptide repeat protein [Microcoleus sp. FACHB-672]|uniref:tetratricopeptide repeat protein n=1 Tax=Microcoleus sp. FACHB-672 TaxID=2692825 RepID=UPI00168961FC|nr:tetratricopeptide repeat protein [Microcoleus sp. FACHB-672]MBD2040685.1 tetratricopeptide repeat protein [Microcoleus sp. FACHB-672]